MKFKKPLFYIVVLGMLLPSCFLVKRKKVNQKPIARAAAAVPVLDQATALTDVSQLKSFSEMVPASFNTDNGFFNIQKLENKYFLEIPDTLLGRRILLVNRIVKDAGDQKRFPGEEIGKSLIRFVNGPKQKLYVEKLSYLHRSSDSSFNGMYRNVQLSSLQPVVASFELMKRRTKGQSSVVDMSDFLAGDTSLLGFTTEKRKGLIKDESHVIGIKTFDTNVELQTQRSYRSGTDTLTYQLNSSFVLLPEKTMLPRFADKRIGYAEETYMDFDDPQAARNRGIITRYRMEPKVEDVERYLNGELVEPLKPIVFYIDRATPRQWIKYLIQGVNDWQKAFEKAGFKHAIYGMEAPVDDKDWNLLDARHNVIVYLDSASTKSDGGRVHDPLTGEILESHLIWSQKAITKLEELYMVQAGANDPAARKMVFDEQLTGRLIRYFCSQLIGKSLGLQPNLIASALVPVENLRNKSYLEQYGLAPSIMDQLQFNYVAQPQDSIPAELLIPRIGFYDEWAIDWGYRWLGEKQSPAQEGGYLDQWLSDQLAKDQRLLYAGDLGTLPTDARIQMDDLGDNAMKASRYGIANLKVVMQNLMSWSQNTGGDGHTLKGTTHAVFTQYAVYLEHVTNNIRLGSKNRKLEAISFLNQHAFDTPTWLNNSEISKKTGINGLSEFEKCQEKVLASLINQKTFTDMQNSNMLVPLKDQYSFDALVADLSKEIFKELKTGKTLSANRRFLQLSFIEKLRALQSVKDYTAHDMVAISIDHANSLGVLIDKSLPAFMDQESRTHLALLKKATVTEKNNFKK